MADSKARLDTALEGRYRIERELGTGGMATVWLAEDLKHDRKVAIKVLKPELTAVLGGDRFIQEIKTTAQLQHPHILPLFDSGSADGFLYYVMPYIEGETLRAKLDRETQLGIDEAVRITREVADALDYAHRHGIIHRDIKPENILLHDGRPVVADFGIALAVSAAAGGRMTETGTSVGTPHYMSPEQATGDKQITGRSDIYSLASVLYEMLAGEPPHTGGSAQAVIMKIIAEPVKPVTSLRKSVPPNVAAAVMQALEKLPADRFEGAKAFSDALADPGFRSMAAGAASAIPPQRLWKPVAIASTAMAALLMFSTGVLLVRQRSERGTSGEVRLSLGGEDTSLYLGRAGRPFASTLALGPDGTILVFVGATTTRDGSVTTALYRRPLRQEHAEPIPGTDSASTPFFSPDGTSIAFFQGQALRRLIVADGRIETIALHALSGDYPRGASWSEDETIFYAAGTGIFRVPASGGEPTPVVGAMDDAAYGLGQPILLPDGRTILFNRQPSQDPGEAEIDALDLQSGVRTTVLANAMDPVIVAPNLLLFMRQGTLMASTFDAGRARVLGQPRAVLENVMQALFTGSTGSQNGLAQLAVSRSGHIAWAEGGVTPEVRRSVVRVSPDGHETPLGMEPRGYLYVRGSPSGDRIAYVAGQSNHWSLYVHDVARGVEQPLETGSFLTTEIAWSPDGRSIAFTSYRDVLAGNIYRMPADGSGPPERLSPSDSGQNVLDWSSQGAIAYRQDGRMLVLPPGGEPTRVSDGNADEAWGTFSPDGSLLAYSASDKGGFHVYVRPNPGPGPATLVSSGSRDTSPAWSHDGRYLYYLTRDGNRLTMMVADVVSLHPFRVGKPRPLIDPWNYGNTGPARSYDVLPDGSFLVTRPDTAEGGSELIRRGYPASRVHVILNFLDALEAKAP